MPIYDMYTMLPNANGKLFLSNTVIACDDGEKACTEFRFLIMNTGTVTASAWYTVSIVGGATLYSGTVPALAPQVGSSYIEDLVCALPGGLPVGTHSVKVEVGPAGIAATDSYTEDIYVIEEPLPPTVDTNAAKEITTTSAQLGGYLTDSSGVQTNVGVEYGKTTSYGTTVWMDELYSQGWYGETIASLDPDTLYHFRAIAGNTYGTGYGVDKTFTTLPVPIYDMYTMLPNANGKLFLSNTVIACDDGVKACTEFRFLIMNTGTVTASAWYTVSIVGGATLYSGTVPALAPQVGSSYIEDLVCALPGGLPVGTHSVKVEVGVEGSTTATDTYTEDIYVIEEPPAPEVTATYDWSDNNVHINWTLSGLDLTANYNLGFYKKDDPGNEWVYLSDVNLPQPQAATTLTGTEVFAGSIVDEDGIEMLLYLWNWDTSNEAASISMSIQREGTPPSGVEMTGMRYENVCGVEIADNCITADVLANHFGSDSECSFYLEYWNGGDIEHNFTTPIVVPYDPMYDEYGSPELTISVCIPNCEIDHHIRAVASNSFGTGYGEVVIPITVRLDAPTEITQTSVTLNANILSMGTITTGIALFRYGTPTPDTFDYPDTPISSAGAISRTITGLAPNTTYHYSLLARNQYGYPQTNAGTLSFTTLPETVDPPTVSTLDADLIRKTNAVLHGDLTTTSGGASTHIGFEYGETTAYGNILWYDYSTTPRSYWKQVTDLTPDTTYHFRAIATNEYGTGYGEDKTLTTLAEPTYNMSILLPNANGKLFAFDTITACDDSEKACTLYRFQIKNNGNVAIKAWFKVSVLGGEPLWEGTYSLTLDPGETSQVINDVVCALPGELTVGTHTIKVEVSPEGMAATDNHTEDIYVTEEPEPPTVSTTSSGNISQSSATLYGSLLSSSGVSTHIGFEYGETTGYGTTVWDTYTSSTGSYTKGVTGLTPNTTYHFRAIATNEYGASYSSDETFTTLGELIDITFIATAPGISDLHDVDVNDVTDPQNPLYLGRT